MKKTIDGVTYKQHKVNKGCDGCVADYGDALCRTLNDDGGCFVSWKMIKAKGPLQVGSTLKLDGVRYVAHAEEVEDRCDGCAGDGSGLCERITDKAHEKFSNTEDGTCGEHALIWKREVTTPVEGGWIEWAGGECPVSGDTLVEVQLRGGVDDQHAACKYRWSHRDNTADIVRYRVIKPVDPEAVASATQTVMVSFTFPADLDRGTVEGYVQNIVRTALNGTPRDKDAHALLMDWNVE